MIFEEPGKTYESMLLKKVIILPDNLFELEIRNIYGKRQKMIIEIDRISMKKDL